MQGEALHRFDHLVVGIGDLAAGIRELRDSTGVTPALGGEHPHLGTHNALAALGRCAYLEVVAPRPDAGAADSRFVRLSRGLRRLTPILWSVATTDAAETRARLARAGFETSPPAAGSRRTPDGSVVEWRMFDAIAPAPAGTPFFIEWAPASPHPAKTSPPGCTLTKLEIVTDDEPTLTRLLAALELEVPVTAGPPAIRATLACPAGQVEL